MTSEQDPAHDNRQIDPERRDVTVRRAPKFVPFIFVWAVLGVVIAAVSAYTGPENTEFTRGTIFAFMAVLFGLAGILVGSLLFLLIDRASVKRAKQATAVAEPGQEGHTETAAETDRTATPGQDETPAGSTGGGEDPNGPGDQDGTAHSAPDETAEFRREQDGESEGGRRA